MGHASSHTFDPNLLHVMRSVAVFFVYVCVCFFLCGFFWGGGGGGGEGGVFFSFRIFQTHTCSDQREPFKDFIFESFQIQ